MKKLKLTITLMASILFLAPSIWADCPTPVRLEAFDITASSAVLAWENLPDAYRYEVKIQNGPNTPTYEVIVGISDSRLELFGLAPRGEYQFKVRAWCVDGLGSFSDYYTFRTPAGTRCSPPLRLQAGEVTSNSARLAWEQVQGAEKYEVQVLMVESGEVQSTIVLGTRYELLRLNPSTPYEFRVRAFCSDGASAFSGWVPFTTLPSGSTRPQPGRGNAAATAEVYPNPASQALNLRIPEANDGEQVDVKAYNSQGQLFWETTYTAYAGQAEPLSVELLPDGMYVLTAESNGKLLMRERVVVAHR